MRVAAAGSVVSVRRQRLLLALLFNLDGWQQYTGGHVGRLFGDGSGRAVGLLDLVRCDCRGGGRG